MIQFHLSKDLATDLAIQPQASSDADPGSMHWYAHRVTISRRKCIIAMEQQSRYAMVFCGLTKQDFVQFPSLFQERLWREVCAATQLESPLSAADIELLSDLALSLCAEQHYQPGHDRSVTSHINQVKEHLEAAVLYDGYPLPVDDDDALSFGIQANQMLRKCKGDKDYFVPLQVFSDFWLGLLRHLNGEQPTSRQSSTGSTQPLPDNVISVNFNNSKADPP